MATSALSNKDFYGYIYKTTNLINNKIYIGQHKSKSFDVNYYGSGKYLKSSMNKHGKENYHVELIEWCSDKHCLDAREKFWISYYRNSNYPMYNIAKGGEGGDLVTCLPESDYIKFKDRISQLNRLGIIGNKGKHLSEQHKQKIGEGNRGKVHSDEWKKKHDDAIRGKPAWNKGLTVSDERVRKYVHKKGEFQHTEQTKQLLSEKLTGRKIVFSNPTQRLENMRRAQRNRIHSEEELDRVRKIAVGRIWVNNGDKSKMIYPEELQTYLDNGFKKGRIRWKHE